MFQWAQLGLVFLLVCAAAGQVSDGKETVPEPTAPYTLHVYEHRVQVPALVLDARQNVESGLSPEDFTMRLDTGPKFHPLQARLEGDDPLSVAILIDATKAVGPDLLGNFTAQLQSLAKSLLTEHDRVWVYAINCSLIAAPFDDKPPTAAGLLAAVDVVTQSNALHGPEGTEGQCDASRRLWDTVAAVAKRMSSAPGRHVMVVLSTGFDAHSTNSWSRVQEYLAALSVSAFGIRPGGMSLQHATEVRDPFKAMTVSPKEDPFFLLCAGTGGTVLDINADTAGAALEKVLEMVRARYILEFLRPSNSTAGIHQMETVVRDQRALVRLGGVSVTLRDPGAGDPSVVPSDQSQAPLLGKRRVLKR